MSQHAKLLALSETAYQMAYQNIRVEQPRHRAEHEHNWKLMAEFTGRRAAIYQCVKAPCEQTKTIWRMESDS